MQKDINKQIKQMEDLTAKVGKLELLIKSKDTEFEKKIAMFENKLKTLQKVLEEKDLLICNMENKIQKFEANVNSLDTKDKQLNMTKKHMRKI